jgi:hypothetical protein
MLVNPSLALFSLRLALIRQGLALLNLIMIDLA